MVILLVGGILLTLGDIVMKRWLLTQDWKLCLGGMGIWALGLCCLAASMKLQNIAVATLILVFFNVGTLVLAERYFFHSAPLTPAQMLGLTLGISAVILLQTSP